MNFTGASVGGGYGGWTCQACGAWTANGYAHTCYQLSGPQQFFPTMHTVDRSTEIIAELKIVRELLEKLLELKAAPEKKGKRAVEL